MLYCTSLTIVLSGFNTTYWFKIDIGILYALLTVPIAGRFLNCSKYVHWAVMFITTIRIA